jgi:hypothetical protein
MNTTDNDRYRFAQQLYTLTDKSLPEIGEITGIARTTLYDRARKYNWVTLKRAARRSPIVLVEEMYSELSDLTARINARPEGQRIPTREEADLRKKILSSIAAVKKYPTLAEVNMILQSLQKYVRGFSSYHAEFSKMIEAFMSHRDIYGYASWQPEHGEDLNMPTEQEVEAIFNNSSYNEEDELDTDRIDHSKATNEKLTDSEVQLLATTPSNSAPVARSRR